MNIFDQLEMIRATEREDRYSKNLYDWLRKVRSKHWSAPQVFIRIGEELCQADAYDPSRTQCPAIYIGDVFDGDLIGSRLSEILSQGRKAQTWCYSGFGESPALENITENFWSRYITDGKCALDPEHRLYRDRERYETRDSHRTCRWCGREEQRHIELQLRRKEVWAPAAHA